MFTFLIEIDYNRQTKKISGEQTNFEPNYRWVYYNYLKDNYQENWQLMGQPCQHGLY